MFRLQPLATLPTGSDCTSLCLNIYLKQCLTSCVKLEIRGMPASFKP
jgi:hypothetical protein